MAGNNSAWGIDVGVSSLKAIKLRRDGDRVTIEAFDVIEHDKFLSEPDVDRDALIRGTLQKFMAKYAVRRELVYIGVPGSTTFARFVKLPPVETKKIPEIVRFEAIQQIPFPLDQVNWDFHTFQHPDSPDVEVGIFAMKKELVAQVMSNFRAVDMHVQGVVMSPLAVYNAAAYDAMTDDKGTVVIDMGAEHTDLVVMDQGRLWLRSINIGGNHFTDALAKSFKQPFARAEQLKKTAATSKYQKQIYQAMRPIFADLVAEIQRSLGAYNSTHRDSRLERIVGMGNPFKLPNLQKYLQQELKMDVVRLETYRQANVEKAAAFSENILSMTTAYGLAIQALGLAQINTNLLPVEIARTMAWKKKQPWFIAASALVALGAVAIGVQLGFAKSNFDKVESSEDFTNNEARLAKAVGFKNRWDQINNVFDNSQKQLDDQFRLVAARKIWPMIWADIVSTLPQNAATKNYVVVTDMSSDYIPKLSLQDTKTYKGAAQLNNPMVSVDMSGGMPASAPDPSGGFATAAGVGVASGDVVGAPPPGVIGTSDHGFIVSISGYTPAGETRNVNPTVNSYRDKLMNLAPEKNENKPYYYSSAVYSGHSIQATVAGFSGGYGGAGALQPGDNPWVTQHGPYWELLVPDLINFHPAPPPTPGGISPGQMRAQPLGDIPFAIDMYATRLTNPPAQNKTMIGNFTFTLRFKVHIKNIIK